MLPDVYSWHDGTQGPVWKPGNPGNRPPLWIGNGSEVVDNVRQMRKLLGSMGIEQSAMNFSVNEFMVRAASSGPCFSTHALALWVPSAEFVVWDAGPPGAVRCIHRKFRAG